MDVSDFYEKEGPRGLRQLADAVGASRKYLYQIATKRRTPSLKLAKALVAAEPRLTLDDLYEHVTPRERVA